MEIGVNNSLVDQTHVRLEFDFWGFGVARDSSLSLLFT